MSKSLCIHTHDCSCVDVAKHKTMLKNWAEVHKQLTDSQAEVERLKKEHSEQLMYAIQQTEKHCLVEGERRAIAKVDSILKRHLWNMAGGFLPAYYKIRKELGLGSLDEKVPGKPETWGGEPGYSRNGSYQNKGEKQ